VNYYKKKKKRKERNKNKNAGLGAKMSGSLMAERHQTQAVLDFRP
jgi:hypothetical protein